MASISSRDKKVALGLLILFNLLELIWAALRPAGIFARQL